MRRLRYAVAMSLDGYIAGPQGEADWIVSDPEIDFAAMFAEFDTLLMGRRTFEIAGRSGGGSTGKGIKTVVVSRTLAAAEHPRLTIISDHLGERVKALKEEPGKDIWLFGGGDLFRALLDLGLVDTVEVAIIPVLLGRGVPLLPARAGRAALTLDSHRVYAKTGTVSLVYEVAQTAGADRASRPTGAKGRRA